MLPVFGQFLNLLGDGSEFGARFSYIVQKEPRGLSEAFILGENLLDDNVTMILGIIFFYNKIFLKILKTLKVAVWFCQTS